MNTEVLHTIPRLYTALAEWLACMLYIARSPKRISGSSFYGLCGFMLFAQGILLEATGHLSVIFWIPSMAVAVCSMVIFIYACCDFTLKEAIYYTAQAFLLAEFAASLEWQLYRYISIEGGRSGLFLNFAMLAGTYFVVYTLAFHLIGHLGGIIKGISEKEAFTAVFIGVFVFSLSNLSFVYTDTPFSSTLIREIFNIRTLVDMTGLAIIFAYHIQQRELQAQKEISAIQALLQAQYAQYRMSRDSIDLINRKYHDLKHQITILRAESDPHKRASFLDQMESEIKQYEAQNKTGNHVLDTLLTGKALYCSKHHIELTCVADGTLLDFMDVMDVCTLFGNALDNAVECELAIADHSHRMIHIELYGRKGFLILRFENYCEKQLVFNGGFPASTKGDDRFHGYGLKSILYTAEKYGGSVTAKQKDNWFELNVLIPLPRNKIIQNHQNPV